MIEFDGTCGSCPLNWVDYKYSESTVCAVTRNDVEDTDKCDCPTERRAALIAQLGVEDREALELGCRVQKIPGNWEVWTPDITRSTDVWRITRNFYIHGQDESLLANLRAANIGNGWDGKGG